MILAGSKELTFAEPLSKEIPIKEIYAATNSLNDLNFIGQGIAGEHLFELAFREARTCCTNEYDN